MLISDIFCESLSAGILIITDFFIFDIEDIIVKRTFENEAYEIAFIGKVLQTFQCLFFKRIEFISLKNSGSIMVRLIQILK